MQNIPKLEDFPDHCFDDVRFGDSDMLGHVNNSVYATYFETARVRLLFDNDKFVSEEGSVVVLARLTIDFLKELNWPNRICIGTRIDRIGRSSATMQHAIFVDDICISTAESIVVLIDTETRKSTPWPQRMRDKLEPLGVAAST